MLFTAILVKLLHNPGNINPAMNVDAGNDAVFHVVRLWCLLFIHDALAEDVGLAKLLYALTGLYVASLAEFLQSKDIRKVHVVLQEGDRGVLMQVPVCLYKIVVGFVQGFQPRLQSCIILVVGLILQQVGKGFLDALIGFKALYLAMTLNLVGVNVQGNSLSTLGNTKVAFLVYNHAALFHALAKLFIHIVCHRACRISGGYCSPILAAKRLRPSLQHVCLVLAFYRE